MQSPTIQTLPTMDDHGTSWQTRGKWSQTPPVPELQKSGHVYRDGYGIIPAECVSAYWHVDATDTEDGGFTGTLSFPMVRPGTDHRDDKDRCGMDHCSPYLWASMWSYVPGAKVLMPVQCIGPMSWDEIRGRLYRSTWLRFAEYCGRLTPEEATEIESLRRKAQEERDDRERKKEEAYSTPAQDGRILWKGREYDPPTMGQLEEWVSDSVCETPDGDTVEPDHPDSWLSILGLV